MKILGIETSCDETGIALVEGKKEGDSFSFVVHKNALLSQALLHSPYGGVYPNLAKREHIKNLPVLFSEFKSAEYDAIAVTMGPGLEPALWTGITFAEELAKKTGKPLFPINHMEGHLISSLAQGGVIKHVAFPVLGLLISGGHTEFVLMKNWFEYELIGQTLDDAVGEAFDKVARMLSLPYPGGPHISKLAREGRAEGLVSPKKLPRPMIQDQTCDFSFSGLKTSVLYALKDKILTDEVAKTFAMEFEDAVVDVLVAKTRRALEETGAATFVIGGGVAANSHIRERLGVLCADEFSSVSFRTPEVSITGDNAIMIAEAALMRALSGVAVPATAPITARGNLSLTK